jgi:membrane-associated phospholipid phosphatase
MSAATLPSPDTTTTAATDRVIKLTIALLSAYLAATLWPMARYANRAHEFTPLIAHGAALAVAILALASRGAALRPLRDWLLLLLGPFLYVELRWLIEGVGRPHADAMVVGWEHALFPGNPSATWATAMPYVALSEALHAAYASYYLLVYLPPVVLYARGKRDAFAATMLALAITYGVCFVTYLFFPVDGPRFLVGPAAAPDGPVRSFVLHLLAAGSSRGTAFPSSHVAASVVASLAALRFQRRLGIVVALATAGLALGTVYGGFHYLVDALAGAAVGLICWFGALATWRALSTAGEQSATAA